MSSENISSLLTTTVATAAAAAASSSSPSSPSFSSSIVNSSSSLTGETNSTTALNWATEWVGYIALCMFSMVLVVPTLGIVGLMVWEYFSDEAERKAERKKEIDQAMQQHFGGGTLENKKKKKKKKRQTVSLQSSGDALKDQEACIEDLNDNLHFLDDDMLIDDDDDDDDEDDDEDDDSDSLQDVDNIMKQADCLLQKRLRRRKLSKSENAMDAANNFDEILT